MKGSGVVFTHGEGISTPRVRHKRRQPLIKCANLTSIYIFPFLRSYVPLFYAFLCFYLCVVDKGASLCSYVFLICDEKIRPTFVNKAFWLDYFYPFLQDMFLLNEKSFKAFGPLSNLSILLKSEKNIKALDH